MGVLPLGCLQRQESTQRIRIRGALLFPIGLYGYPEILQTFFIGVAILDDERLDPFGMGRRQPVTHRRAIVHQVEAVGLQPD